MEIRSNAFRHGEFIPSKFTCEGVNVSPQLEWSGFPKATVSLALLVDDPDAPVGDWVHWIVYNIPPTTTMFNEHFTKGDSQPPILFGKNDYKQFDYKGPCPPNGVHRYFFKIFALDCFLNKEGYTKAELLKEIDGHVLDKSAIIGKYIKINK